MVCPSRIDSESGPNIVIIQATEAHVSDLVRLSGELGYPTSVDLVAKNLTIISASKNHCLRVAFDQDSKNILGFIHASNQISLADGPLGEVHALVVDSSARGKKIGTKLLLEVENWAAGLGLNGLRFTSRVTRTDAHRLYQRLGYEIQKTSYYFSKNLVPAANANSEPKS